MVSDGPKSAGTRVTDKDYPYVEGLIAGSTKDQDEPSLIEEPW